MLKQPQDVKKFDLSPKLKRPLQLWNPLDYLLLLYWFFYFPQALLWYEDKWGNEESLQEQKTWQKKWQWLQENKIIFHLLLQSSILGTIGYFISFRYFLDIYKSLRSIEAPDFRFFLMLSLFTILVTLAGLISYGFSMGISVLVVYAWLPIIIRGILSNFSNIFLFWVDQSTPMGWIEMMSGSYAIMNITIASRRGVNSKMRVIGVGILIGLLFGVFNGIRLYLLESNNKIMLPLYGVLNGLLYAFMIFILDLRLDSWVLATLNSKIYFKKNFTHATSILPIPGFVRLSTIFWEKDWQIGFYNLNQYLQFSSQFIFASYILNHQLSNLDKNKIFYALNFLAQNLYDWELIKYFSVSLSSDIINSLLKSSIFIRGKNFLNLSLRFDNHKQIIAAGFWSLHNQDPTTAIAAFSRFQSIPYGQEFYCIAKNLETLEPVNKIEDFQNVLTLTFPESIYHLHPNTWQAFQSFNDVIQEVKNILGADNTILQQTAGLNRSLGDLRHIVDHNQPYRWRHSLPADRQPGYDDPERLPEPERQMIYEIAQRWLVMLERLAGEVGNITITEPIPMPYVVGDPVQGQLFVGREDLMRELEALWGNPQQLQSIILYGHRRMGKTSILKNLQPRLQAKNTDLNLVYINLQTVANLGEGLAELCYFLADEIADALTIEPPTEAAINQHPEITFRRFLRTWLKQHPDQGLLIALDEYELLNKWLQDNKLDADFIETLASWIQLDSRLGFVLAGWHNLEEMGDSWQNPIYGKFITKHIGFLSKPATLRLLREPNENFALPYAGDLVQEIYRLTYGQPFLVNLIGFELIEHYNRQKFYQRQKRDDQLTLADLDAILVPDFYQRHSNYFQGLREQAGDGCPDALMVLNVLCHYADGLSEAQLTQQLPLSSEQIQTALKHLCHRDLLRSDHNHHRLSIPLFRRWLAQITR